MMPRKVIPIPGVPPHEWHKHQPTHGEGEQKKGNMTTPEKNIPMKTESVKVKTESVTPQDKNDIWTHKVTKKESVTPKDQTDIWKPKASKISMKQWETTANEPLRMPGQREPPRAAPKFGEGTNDGGRLLYPHEAVVYAPAPSSTRAESEESFHRSPILPEPHQSQNLSGMAQPQPVIIYNHNKPEKWWSEPAEVQQPHKDSGRDDRWKGKGRAQPDSDDSDEAPEPHTESHERRELRVMNPGPRDVDNQRRKSRDPFQSDDYPSSSPQDQHPAKAEPLRMHRNVAKKGKRFQSDTDSESVAPAPMRSPDLSAMKIPRPNHKYVASVRSIVSVLSLDEDDNARRDTYPEQSLVKHGDLRSKIGEEHGLYMSADGKLIDTNIWQEKARQPETVFVNPAANREWIEDYVENRVDYNVRATFLYEEDSAVHCHSDVNTFSGKLLKPTQYDYTVPDYIKSVAMDRQMNCSANLFCQIRAGKGNKGNGRSNNSVGPPPPPPPGWVETPAPVSTTASPEATVQKPGQIVVRARADSDTNPFAPRIPCHLRPAKMEHMPGVQSIYNWEVLHGLQATDTEPLSLADWQGILHKSHEEKLPFIVVIGGPYQYQVRDKSYEGTTEQSAQLPITGKVLAFGFLTIRQPGLTGSFNGTSRMSAKAHVFVHPAYRRQKLGHVCFDKLLSTVSTRYSTKLGYDFINVTDNPTYKYPWQHDRKLYSIFVEYLVPRTRADINSRFEPDEKDLKLFAKALKDRYGFWNVGTLQAAHRSRVTYEPAPIWLDLVMFEHMCQEGLGFTRTL